jgi:asparagine synthase (glutamine-hydrolysing)
VLTGEGSDEIFAGYPHFRRDLLLAQARTPGGAGDVEQLLARLQSGNQVSSGLLLPLGPSQALGGLEAVLGFAPSWLEAFSAQGVRLFPLFSDGFARVMAGRDAYRALLDGLDVRGQLHGRHPVHQSMYTWSKTFLPNYILSVLGDRMEMSHSVEGRVPFLDHKVVELACRLPVGQKIHDMIEKHILREAARPVLTETVYRRQKHPFLAPPALLNPDGRLHALLQDVARGPALAALPFYDQRKVVALLDRLPQLDAPARAAYDNALTGILSACLLQQQLRLAA